MRRFLLAAALVVLAGSSRAGTIVVVVPDSPSSPYKEALQGVCDALGACPAILTTAGEDVEMPADARVVIALGGRAARRLYPSSITLVTALSPGFEARTRAGSGPVVHVRMTLAPDEFIRRLISLKPKAKSAALLWAEPASGRFAENVRAAAAPLGVAVRLVRVSDPDAVPALLRGLPPTDALWLAPDTALVTPTTFDAACEYARSTAVSFFAPAPALAARCGLAGLAPDFRSAGLRAGSAAREALAGTALEANAYPQTEAAPEPLADIIASTRTRSGR